MSNLEKVIKKLEVSLALQDYYIKEQNNLILQHSFNGKWLPIAAVSCFAFGFLLTRKKTITQSATKLIKLSLMGKRLFNNFKNVLSFL